MGFAGWFCMGLLLLPYSLRNSKSKTDAVGAVVMCAVPALLTAFLPEGNWPWRHLVFYPLLTLVAVFVVGVLAAIAVPSFVKARDASQRNVCVNNMRMLDTAKEQAALRGGLREGADVSEQDVSPYLVNGFGGLVCPKGGRYRIMALGHEPECTLHGALSSEQRETGESGSAA